MINRTLAAFIKKELLQALRDPRMKFILFVAPIVQMTLFGVALSNEVKNIRLAARFDAKDTVMRQVYDRAIQGGWFVPARAAGADDPFELIRSNRADAVLVPPPGGFTRALGRGDASLQLLIDATDVNQAQSVEAYLKAIERFRVVNEPQLKPVHLSGVIDKPSLETLHRPFVIIDYAYLSPDRPAL